MWTLIIIASMFSSGGGWPVAVSAHSVPNFSHKEDCEKAGLSLPKPGHARRDESETKFICVKNS